MAINRGPFNALIDDDGSGMTGSVWNKAAIQSVLLDPIDANPTWIDVPFNAANFGAGAPMTWTLGAPAVLRNRYAILGKLLYWSLSISWYSGNNVLGGAPGPTILMTLPASLVVASQQAFAFDYVGGVAGAPLAGGLQAQGSFTYLTITKSSGGNFALTDTPGLIGTAIFELT